MLAVVPAGEFRRVFSDLKPILRFQQDGAILGFSIEQHLLKVTCKTGIIYERQFACEPEGPLYVTVIYRDISEFLPGKGTVQLDISDTAVEVRATGFSTTFTKAYGEVLPYKPRCQDTRPLPKTLFPMLARVYGELSVVSKTLKTESSILLQPPAAICKYSTIWLEVPFEGFSTSIGLREVRTVANFEPESYGVAQGIVEFRKGPAVLAIPCNEVENVKLCEDVLVQPAKPLPLYSASVLPKVTQFSRAVSGACQLAFFSDGYKLTYKSNVFSLECVLGNCTEYYYTLDTYAEYLPMIFRLIDEAQAFLTVGRNAVMIEVPGSLRLLHSIV